MVPSLLHSWPCSRQRHQHRVHSLFLHQPDQRHDRRQRHQHRGLAFSAVHQPDQRHDSGNSVTRHRRVRVLLAQPERHDPQQRLPASRTGVLLHQPDGGLFQDHAHAEGRLRSAVRTMWSSITCRQGAGGRRLAVVRPRSGSRRCTTRTSQLRRADESIRVQRRLGQRPSSSWWKPARTWPTPSGLRCKPTPSAATRSTSAIPQWTNYPARFYRLRPRRGSPVHFHDQ